VKCAALGRVCAALGLAAAVARAEEPAMKLTSPAFEHNARIPRKHTGEGEDASPPLRWENPPAGTRAFALICDDPDAVRVAGIVWDHWLIWNLPAETRELPENVGRAPTLPALGGARQGRNSWPRTGYNGPMPPPGSGPHRYRFRLYALDAPLDLPPNAGRPALEAAMKGHILAEAELVGVYERK